MQISLLNDKKDAKSEMETARGVLKYTLHLDMKLENVEELRNMHKENKMQEFVSEIAKQMIEICKRLFKGEEGNLGFFGTRITKKDSPWFSYWVENYSSSFWKDSIIQQCIISVLYTLRYIYLEGDITPYRFESYAVNVGGSYIIENYTDEKGLWKTSIQSGQSKDNAGNGTDYLRVCRTYGKNSKLGEGLQEFYRKNEERIKLQDVPFIGYLYKNKKVLHSIDKKVADSSKIYSVTNYAKLIKSFQIMDYDRKDYYSKADQLLLEYELERTFHYSLALEVVRLFIEQREKLENMSLGEIAKLAAQLPNAFSRNLYLRYMIESIWNDSVDPNYFTKRENSGRKGMYRIELRMSDLHRRFEWQELARKFCLFASELVFPVCERCFLILFMDAIKLCLGTENFDSILKNGQEVLEKFIEVSADNVKGIGLSDYPGCLFNKGDGFHILSLSELLSEDFVLKEYRTLPKDERTKCDLLLKETLKAGGRPCDKTQLQAFDENYFETRSDNNKGVYKRLLGTYMEMKGIY